MIRRSRRDLQAEARRSSSDLSYAAPPDLVHQRHAGATRVAEDFYYTSRNNTEWLSGAQLQKLLSAEQK